MTEKPTTCAKCGTALAPYVGTGRPSAYCGEVCRRLAEYEIKRIDRRLAQDQLQLREELADRNEPDAWIDNLGRNRRQRIGDLRKWIKADEARLRELVGSSAQRNTPKG